MTQSKIAVSVDEQLVARLDQLVRTGVVPDRDKAVQSAVEEVVDYFEGRLLERECAKLDPEFEKALAEEGLAGDAPPWPEY